MPIEFNLISGGSRKKPGDQQRGRIDFKKIKVGRQRRQSSEGGDSPPPKKGLTDILKERAAAKQAAAKAARIAEQQRLADLHRQEELERRERIQAARNRITQEAAKGGERTGSPGIDFGLPNMLATIAAKDPEKAVQLGNSYLLEAQEENQRLTDEWQINLEKRAAGRKKKEELKDKPYRAWGSTVSKQDRTKPPVRRILGSVTSTGKSGLDYVGHLILSGFTGNRKDARNNLELTEEGLTTFAPGTKFASRKIRPDQRRDHIISVDPPEYLDGLLGLFGNIFDEQTIERYVPLGELIVTDRPGNIELTKVVTWFPGRKKQLIEETLETLDMPSGRPPDLLPIPDTGLIFNRAAQEIQASQGE